MKFCWSEAENKILGSILIFFYNFATMNAFLAVLYSYLDFKAS